MGIAPVGVQLPGSAQHKPRSDLLRGLYLRDNSFHVIIAPVVRSNYSKGRLL